MGKPMGVFLCLLLAVPLAGIGALAAFSTGKTFWDARRALDWVRVRVDVVPGQFDAKPGGPGSGHFAYTFDGRRHEGRRLALGGLGGRDDIDQWRTDVAESLQSAKAAGQSVSLWVNPDDPSESVLDRSIPWHEPILLGLVALGFGGAGIGVLRSALAIATGNVTRESGPGAGGGAVFLWVFATIWNAMAFGISWLLLGEILESREWPGLFILLFPVVGILLVWGAAAATASAIKARVAKSAPEPARKRSEPRPPSLQAARSPFDSSMRDATGPQAFKGVDLPASVATIAVQGGVLTVRFSRRRWLAPAIIVFVIGAVLALAGFAMIFDDGIGPGTVLLLAIAAAMDVGGVALLVGSLVVRARQGEIAVEKGGLFGRKSWQLRRESVMAIRPVLSYTVNNVPYFTVRAETPSGERVVLGDSLKGEALAERYASRLASVAGFPSTIVRAISHSPSDES